jgi:hypothetical protein
MVRSIFDGQGMGGRCIPSFLEVCDDLDGELVVVVAAEWQAEQRGLVAAPNLLYMSLSGVIYQSK